MFLLRLLSYALRPSDKQLRTKNKGRWIRFKLKSYSFLLKMLLESYSHYAMSDEVSFAGGGVIVVHECRDLAFECELVRMKIDIQPHLERGSFPSSVRRRRRKIWHKYFDFKDVLCVYVDGKELFIKNDGLHSVGGSADAQVKISGPCDILTRSKVEIKCREVTRRVSSGCEVKREIGKGHVNKGKAAVGGPLFGKDKIRRAGKPEAVVSPENDKAGAEDNQTVGRRGFDIDTTF